MSRQLVTTAVAGASLLLFIGSARAQGQAPTPDTIQRLRTELRRLQAQLTEMEASRNQGDGRADSRSRNAGRGPGPRAGAAGFGGFGPGGAGFAGAGPAGAGFGGFGLGGGGRPGLAAQGGGGRERGPGPGSRAGPFGTPAFGARPGDRGFGTQSAAPRPWGRGAGFFPSYRGPRGAGWATYQRPWGPGPAWLRYGGYRGYDPARVDGRGYAGRAWAFDRGPGAGTAAALARMERQLDQLNRSVAALRRELRARR